VVGSSRLVLKEALLSIHRAFGTTRSSVTKALENRNVQALVLFKPKCHDWISLVCFVQGDWGESNAVAPNSL